MTSTNNFKIGLVSLGCPKNQCDAELILHKIAKAGYSLVNEPGLADIVIINTCAFIQSAKEEAIEEILEAISRKNDGINKKVIITGCLSERYKHDLAEEFPEVDAIIGLGANDDIISVIESAERVLDFSGEHNMEGERLLSTATCAQAAPHYAYLRIADGCDNKCSYCAIPLIRGSFRTRTVENIISEAQNLVENGVKELILVAQDVTNYPDLPNLLKSLTKIDKLKWIRLLYCYPHRITDELIQIIKTEDKIVKYLDIPIQHSNYEILQAMNRQDCDLRGLAARLRREIPEIVIRTTVLAGFPGETEEQFTELAEFVHEVRFEHLGCFAYSQEEGTPAAEFPDQVDNSEAVRRCEIIVEQQELRVAEWSDKLIGKEFEVVCEGFDRYSDMYFGRSYMHAPEIDSMIYFSSKLKPGIGQFVTVKIVEVIDNNLIGDMI
jgi:ribosomal protein S12 methylthiotransferase